MEMKRQKMRMAHELELAKNLKELLPPDAVVKGNNQTYPFYMAEDSAEPVLQWQEDQHGSEPLDAKTDTAENVYAVSKGL